MTLNLSSIKVQFYSVSHYIYSRQTYCNSSTQKYFLNTLTAHWFLKRKFEILTLLDRYYGHNGCLIMLRINRNEVTEYATLFL